MAYAFETGGYGFAPALVPVDQQALQGLKPLSFAGGGQSPVQFKPLAGWSVPSSHPELIAQGISSGLGSIAQGIEAAYKSKEAKAEKQKDREYDLQKYESQRKTKLEDEETFARFRASLPSRYPTKSESIPPDYYSEETGDYGTSVMSSTPPPDSSEAPAPRAERYKRDISPIKGGSFNEINLPEEDENSVPARLRNLKNSLGDITSPVPISEAPSPRGQDAVNALSSIDWSKVQGSLGAGAGAGASPVDIPAQAPDWLRKPKAVTATLSTLGGVSDESLPNVEQALADAQTAYASGTIQPSESLKSAGGVPKAAFKSYSEAQRYIDSQSDNPNWYAEGAPKPDKFGNFVIPWKQNDPAIKASRKEAAQEREEAKRQKQEESKKGSTLLQDQMKVISNVENARNTLKDITERLATTDAGPIWGRVVGLNPYNATAVSVENMVTSLVPQLARGVFGEVGVLTDRDVERYKALIPNMRTDPKVAKTILDDLMRRLNKTKQTNLDVWDKAGYDVSRFKESPRAEASSLDGEKSEMEALGKELRAVPDKDRKSYPDFEKKKARYIDLKEKLESNIYTDKKKGVIQEVKDSAKSALSSLPLPPISIAGF